MSGIASGGKGARVGLYEGGIWVVVAVECLLQVDESLCCAGVGIGCKVAFETASTDRAWVYNDVYVYSWV